MPAPSNPGRGPGGIGPGGEQPAVGRHPLRRFRISSLISSAFSGHRVSQVAVETLVQKTSKARVSQEAVEVLIQTHHKAIVSQVAVEVLTSALAPLAPVTIAGKGSLTATIHKGGIPVTIAGTSSLTATITKYHRFTVTLAGSSTLTTTAVKYHRFTVTISGTSTLLAYLGTPGSRLSQVALEIAKQALSANRDARLSQVTVELVRSRAAVHVWTRF